MLSTPTAFKKLPVEGEEDVEVLVDRAEVPVVFLVIPGVIFLQVREHKDVDEVAYHQNKHDDKDNNRK